MSNVFSVEGHLLTAGILDGQPSKRVKCSEQHQGQTESGTTNQMVNCNKTHILNTYTIFKVEEEEWTISGRHYRLMTKTIIDSDNWCIRMTSEPVMIGRSQMLKTYYEAYCPEHGTELISLLRAEREENRIARALVDGVSQQVSPVYSSESIDTSENTVAQTLDEGFSSMPNWENINPAPPVPPVTNASIDNRTRAILGTDAIQTSDSYPWIIRQINVVSYSGVLQVIESCLAYHTRNSIPVAFDRTMQIKNSFLERTNTVVNDFFLMSTLFSLNPVPESSISNIQALLSSLNRNIPFHDDLYVVLSHVRNTMQEELQNQHQEIDTSNRSTQPDGLSGAAARVLDAQERQRNLNAMRNMERTSDTVNHMDNSQFEQHMRATINEGLTNDRLRAERAREATQRAADEFVTNNPTPDTDSIWAHHNKGGRL